MPWDPCGFLLRLLYIQLSLLGVVWLPRFLDEDTKRQPTSRAGMGDDTVTGQNTSRCIFRVDGEVTAPLPETMG